MSGQARWKMQKDLVAEAPFRTPVPQGRGCASCVPCARDCRPAAAPRAPSPGHHRLPALCIQPCPCCVSHTWVHTELPSLRRYLLTSGGAGSGGCVLCSVILHIEYREWSVSHPPPLVWSEPGSPRWSPSTSRSIQLVSGTAPQTGPAHGWEVLDLAALAPTPSFLTLAVRVWPLTTCAHPLCCGPHGL